MTLSTPPTRPRRFDEPDLVRSSDGSALLMRIDQPPVSLNPTALALWELCDGATHVDEMAAAVCELFAISLEQARQDVGRALRDMHVAGVIR